jgi:hypothetical protein
VLRADERNAPGRQLPEVVDELSIGARLIAVLVLGSRSRQSAIFLILSVNSCGGNPGLPPLPEAVRVDRTYAGDPSQSAAHAARGL